MLLDVVGVGGRQLLLMRAWRAALRGRLDGMCLSCTCMRTFTAACPPEHRLQVRLPPTGARLVLATDGLWDVVPPGRTLRLLRQHATPKAAAMEAVSAVATQRCGLLTDDITGGLWPGGGCDCGTHLGGWRKAMAALCCAGSRRREVL